MVARRQLAAAGVTPAMVKSRVASGHLVPLHRGVFAVGHARLRREGYWLAAVLAAGPGAVLSHRDAATLHGLRFGEHQRIDVTTAGRATSTRAIRVHRTTVLDLEDVTRTELGIPVTSIARTLVDLAAVVNAQSLAKTRREAERSYRLDTRAIEDVLKRTAQRRGTGHAAMRAALGELAAGRVQMTRSALEEAFLRLLDAYDLPRPLTNHMLGAIEVDALWPRHKLVVELDGYAFHNTTRAFQRDRDRTNELLEAGYAVRRFTHADVARRPAHVAANIARALADAKR